MHDMVQDAATIGFKVALSMTENPAYGPHAAKRMRRTAVEALQLAGTLRDSQSTTRRQPTTGKPNNVHPFVDFPLSWNSFQTYYVAPTDYYWQDIMDEEDE